MGCCSNKKKETNQPFDLSLKELKFSALTSTKETENKKTLKSIKILFNFNRVVNSNNVTTNIPKLLDIVRENNYNIEYAYQENKPSEKYDIAITLICDTDVSRNFIIYSNFGKSSSMETLHGDFVKMQKNISNLIIKKYEENLLPIKIDPYMEKIINNEEKKFDNDNKNTNFNGKTNNQIYLDVRNDYVVKNI